MGWRPPRPQEGRLQLDRPRFREARAGADRARNLHVGCLPSRRCERLRPAYESGGSPGLSCGSSVRLTFTVEPQSEEQGACRKRCQMRAAQVLESPRLPPIRRAESAASGWLFLTSRNHTHVQCTSSVCAMRSGSHLEGRSLAADPASPRAVPCPGNAACCELDGVSGATHLPRNRALLLRPIRRGRPLAGQQSGQ